MKAKLSFVGWQLWMSGSNVDERYWKADVDDAIFLLKRHLLIAAVGESGCNTGYLECGKPHPVVDDEF